MYFVILLFSITLKVFAIDPYDYDLRYKKAQEKSDFYFQALEKNKADVIKYEEEIKISKTKKAEENLDQAKYSIYWNEQNYLRYHKEASDYEFIKKNASSFTCGDDTTAIDLEEKTPFSGATFPGPFYQVSRDNQDGIGSCFANGAKNLLFSLSQGKMNSSFLDVALQMYREDDGKLRSHIINGGESCYAMEQIKKYGYCDQKNAPYEKGLASPLEGLISSGTSSVDAQAGILNLLGNYLNKLQDLKKNKDSISQYLSAKNVEIIQYLKDNADVVIPLPVIRHQFPPDYKLNEMYVWEINKSVPKEEFYKDFRFSYQNFYPQFISAAADGSSLADIFALWKTQMKPFLDKYQIKASTIDSMFYSFRTESEKDFAIPNRKESFKKSLKFLKDILGQEKISDTEFLSQCQNSFNGQTDYLKSVYQLVQYFGNKKLNPDLLLDSNKNLKSGYELLQLVIAPNCLNPKNRMPVDFNFHCENGASMMFELRGSQYTPKEQMYFVRERALVNLFQGKAVGNVFDQHINTIVGFRYNSATDECEYKIRESQDGKSTWQLEKDIFKKIDGLTEVWKVE